MEGVVKKIASVFTQSFPIVRAADSDELEDPQNTLRSECNERCAAQLELLNTCNERVESKIKTTESCLEEMIDFIECLDHCVAPKLMAKLK